MDDEEREAGTQAERVRNLENDVNILAATVGKIQSDMVNVKTGLVAQRERMTTVIVLGIGLLIMSNLVTIIVILTVVAK